MSGITAALAPKVDLASHESKWTLADCPRLEAARSPCDKQCAPWAMRKLRGTRPAHFPWAEEGQL
eukprot:2726519-Pyramimonas_sp.AAC.1